MQLLHCQPFLPKYQFIDHMEGISCRRQPGEKDIVKPNRLCAALAGIPAVPVAGTDMERIQHAMPARIDFAVKPDNVVDIILHAQAAELGKPCVQVFQRRKRLRLPVQKPEQLAQNLRCVDIIFVSRGMA